MNIETSNKKLLPSLMLILMLSTIPGCANKRPVDAREVWCATNSPERPTVAEYALYDRSRKEQMASHNQFGMNNCGWKP